jgi:hypothetical protein
VVYHGVDYKTHLSSLLTSTKSFPLHFASNGAFHDGKLVPILCNHVVYGTSALWMELQYMMDALGVKKAGKEDSMASLKSEIWMKPHKIGGTLRCMSWAIDTPS